MDRRCALARGEIMPDRCTGAALFADISGFVPLTSAFVGEMGPQRGADALLHVINPMYEALIAPLHYYGGSVLNFAGDAITCWLDASDAHAEARAVVTALAMQAAMCNFAQVRTPGGTLVPLSIKVAVAAGSARRFLVGNPDLMLVDVLAGALLARMSDAEHHAGRGEVVVSAEVVDVLGKALVVDEWRDTYAVVAGLESEVAPMRPAAEDRLSDEHLHSWVLPSIYEHLLEGTTEVGSLRPVTPLFLKFGGIDYDGDDDAGTKLNTFVRDVQQIVHRHGGSLLQLVVGDKGAYAYAVFGAPLAHEDDAARAMRAALAIRKLPPELAAIDDVQMGLTRGTVWSGDCGAAVRRAYAVIGSDVNLSARLMDAAGAGQILVSERLAATPGFKFAPLGQRHYKGFAEPITTYELCAEQLSVAQIFSEEMVGRETELQQLVDFAQPLFVGEQAGAALIYGEAGIGKSRLAYALRECLGERVSWFTAQTDAILRQAFNPFVYWLKRTFQQSPEATADENRARFDARLNQLHAALRQPALELPFSVIQQLDTELERTRSFLGALLGLHWTNSLYEQLGDPKLRRDNTLIAIKTLLLAESCLRPVVFELEDGHWLDKASREMLLALSLNVTAYPLLIIITSRYADDGSKPVFELAPELPALTFDLNALPREALRQQAAMILGAPVAPRLLDLLWEYSRANPFFAQQILLYLQGNGQLERSTEGSWDIASTQDALLPDTLNTMLVARIDRLAHQVKETVQTASVLGREFEVQVLSRMLRADVLPDVRKAEQEQIWLAMAELRYLFKHTLLRDAAYAMQLRTRLRDLHQLAAKAYEELYVADLSPYYADLAYHYRHTQDIAKERKYAELAGVQAAAEFANDEAVRFFDRVLELTPPSEHENRCRVLLARERVYDLRGNRTAQYQDLEMLNIVVDLLGDDRKATVELRRAYYYFNVGDYRTATATAQQAIAWAQATQDATMQASGHYLWGEAARLQGDYTTAQAQYKQALVKAQQTGAKSAIARSLWGLGSAIYEQGDYATAQAHLERALSIYREVGDQVGEANCLNSLSIVSSDRGDFAARQAYIDQSLQIKRVVGDRRGVGIGLNNLGERYRACGQYYTARKYYQEALQIFRDINERRGESICLNNLGFVCRDLGDYQQAEIYQQDGLAILQEIENRRGVAIILSELGVLACDLDKLDQAEAYFHRALALRREMKLPQNVVEDLAGLAQVALARGNQSQAAAYVDEILVYLEDNPMISGAERPFRVHLICYQVLRAAGDDRASVVLRRAHCLLQGQAKTIPDDDLQASYLQNVPCHREIIEKYTHAEKETSEG